MVYVLRKKQNGESPLVSSIHPSTALLLLGGRWTGGQGRPLEQSRADLIWTGPESNTWNQEGMDESEVAVQFDSLRHLSQVSQYEGRERESSEWR